MKPAGEDAARIQPWRDAKLQRPTFKNFRAYGGIPSVVRGGTTACFAYRFWMPNGKNPHYMI